MTLASIDHILPRLLNGDPCPRCGHELRISTGERARRLGSIILEALPMLSVALFLALLSGDGTGSALTPERDVIDDATYIVQSDACGEAFDVWGGRDAGWEDISRMPDK